MKTAEILLEAKARLQQKGWHKGSWAMHQKSKSHVHATNPEADSFCLVGAVMACGKPFEVQEVLASLYKAIFGTSVVPAEVGVYLSNWNDASARSKKEVMDAVDKAVTLATP